MDEDDDIMPSGIYDRSKIIYKSRPQTILIRKKISKTLKKIYKLGKRKNNFNDRYMIQYLDLLQKERHYKLGNPKGFKFSEKSKRKMSKTRKRLLKEGKLKSHPNFLNYYKNDANREKQSQSMKNKWQIPEYREKQIRSVFEGLKNRRPTSFEKEFIKKFKKYNLPYKYVGNGSFLIGWKNPDFVNINGEKICIEVRPERVCKHFNNITFEEYTNRQKKHYLEYGWKCVVLSDNDLNIKQIRDKIGEINE